jgi:hypothetical protein
MRDPGSTLIKGLPTRKLTNLSHSFRLEHKLGPRLKVVALIDPSISRAESVLDGKRQSFVESAYKDTKTFKTIEDFKAAMTPEEEPQ